MHFWCVLNVVAVLLVLDRGVEDLSDWGGADVVAADADESQGDQYEDDVATLVVAGAVALRLQLYGFGHFAEVVVVGLDVADLGRILLH